MKLEMERKRTEKFEGET